MIKRMIKRFIRVLVHLRMRSAWRVVLGEAGVDSLRELHEEETYLSEEISRMQCTEIESRQEEIAGMRMSMSAFMLRRSKEFLT